MVAGSPGVEMLKVKLVMLKVKLIVGVDVERCPPQHSVGSLPMPVAGDCCPLQGSCGEEAGALEGLTLLQDLEG